MKTVRSWLIDAAKTLEKISSQPLQESIWIAQHLLPSKIISPVSHEQITEVEEEKLNQLLSRRQSTEPLGYIIGSVPFLQATIEIKKPILIPRPETEEMIAWLIEKIKTSKQNNLTIADICTGSGCIAISLGIEFPQAKITAVDIESAATNLAQKNTVQNNVKNVTIKEGNFFDPLEKQSYDIIVCNPPYLSKQEWEELTHDVKNWESNISLTDQHDGLTWYRLLAKKGKQYLRTTDNNIPRIICEIGQTQGSSVQSIFIDSDWENVQIHQDISQKDRWITAC